MENRAQRKANLCPPGAPKGPKVGMSVRQYEILCANDAGRAPRKYPGFVAIRGDLLISDTPLNWWSWVRILLEERRFGTLAIPFTALCQCLSEEALRAADPFLDYQNS